MGFSDVETLLLIYSPGHFSLSFFLMGFCEVANLQLIVQPKIFPVAVSTKMLPTYSNHCSNVIEIILSVSVSTSSSVALRTFALI